MLQWQMSDMNIDIAWGQTPFLTSQNHLLSSPYQSNTIEQVKWKLSYFTLRTYMYSYMQMLILLYWTDKWLLCQVRHDACQWKTICYTVCEEYKMGPDVVSWQNNSIDLSLPMILKYEGITTNTIMSNNNFDLL